MYILGYLVRTTLYIAIDAVILMMFIHAIMSWISPGSNNAIMRFIGTVVGFVVIPVRLLLSRFEAINNLPIDLSFTITWLLLMMLQAGIAAI